MEKPSGVLKVMQEKLRSMTLELYGLEGILYEEGGIHAESQEEKDVIGKKIEKLREVRKSLEDAERNCYIADCIETPK